VSSERKERQLYVVIKAEVFPKRAQENKASQKQNDCRQGQAGFG
jgi:hypothetical protein